MVSTNVVFRQLPKIGLAIFVLTVMVCGQQADGDEIDRWQADDAWERFALLEDGFVEVDTTTVVWGKTGEDTIGRVFFRTTYQNEMRLPGDPPLKYHQSIVTLELNCTQRHWRTLLTEFLDKNGKIIKTQAPAKPDLWYGSMGVVGRKHVAAGCSVIEKARGTEEKAVTTPPNPASVRKKPN